MVDVLLHVHGRRFKVNLGPCLYGDLHCFDVTAISKPVHDALEADNLWPDVEEMLPRMFLPSPVTWIEYRMHAHSGRRIAWVIEDQGEGAFRLSMVLDDPRVFSMPLCDFRARGMLEVGERIHISLRLSEAKARAEERGYQAGLRDTVGDLAERLLPHEQRSRLLGGRVEMAKLELAHEQSQLDRVQAKIDQYDAAADIGGEEEIEGLVKLGIAFSVLTLDLINTPGLIGLRQHDPHRGLARKLGAYRSGSYPLRGWSEVVLKHQTRIAGEAEHHTGATFHKCLHFVRSHLRHYQDGKVTVIPAHWRGDPALGIKRTRYRLAA
jgi:hypothetical protein